VCSKNTQYAVSNGDSRRVRINQTKGRGLMSQGVFNRIPPRATCRSRALVARRGTTF
jgi:hypothetical protein